jgi:hypothetical protein
VFRVTSLWSWTNPEAVVPPPAPTSSDRKVSQCLDAKTNFNTVTGNFNNFLIGLLRSRHA